jgi:hypothetical protein
VSFAFLKYNFPRLEAIGKGAETVLVRGVRVLNSVDALIEVLAFGHIKTAAGDFDRKVERSTTPANVFGFCAGGDRRGVGRVAMKAHMWCGSLRLASVGKARGGEAVERRSMSTVRGVWGRMRRAVGDENSRNSGMGMRAVEW